MAQFEEKDGYLPTDVNEDWDATVIEGAGLKCYVRYGLGDRLTQLHLFVHEDNFTIYIDVVNPDGGEQCKVVVRDLAKLMTVLSVTHPEDLIDALIDKCKTVEEPLSVGCFFGLLKKNELKYDEQVIGEYTTEFDDDGNLGCTYHPMKTINE